MNDPAEPPLRRAAIAGLAVGLGVALTVVLLALGLALRQAMGLGVDGGAVLREHARRAAPQLAAIGLEVDTERVRFGLADAAVLREALAIAGDADLERTRRALACLMLQAPPPLAEFRDSGLDAILPSLEGLYLPEDRRLWLSETVWQAASPVQRRALMTHELTHAWQHAAGALGPDSRPEWRYASGDDGRGGVGFDRFLVRKCVIEGHATLVQFEAELRRHGRSLAEFRSEDVFTHAHGVYRPRDPEFEYLLGAAYLLAQAERRGLEAVLRLDVPLPVSTEAFLHPEKADDVPTAVSLPPAPAGVDVHEDTLGELGLIFGMLASGQGPEWRNGSGWDGDRIRTEAHPDGTTAVLLRVVCDREEDARDLESCYRSGPSGRLDQRRVVRRAATVDVTWSEDAARRDEAAARLHAWPPEYAGSWEDAETTASIPAEAPWRETPVVDAVGVGAAAARRVRFPVLGVSLPIGASWEFDPHTDQGTLRRPVGDERAPFWKNRVQIVGEPWFDDLSHAAIRAWAAGPTPPEDLVFRDLSVDGRVAVAGAWTDEEGGRWVARWLLSGPRMISLKVLFTDEIPIDEIEAVLDDVRFD